MAGREIPPVEGAAVKADDKVSTQQAADILGCFPTHLYYLLHARLIEAERVDGRWRISRQSVERYKARHPRIGRARAQELQAVST